MNGFQNRRSRSLRHGSKWVPPTHAMANQRQSNRQSTSKKDANSGHFSRVLRSNPPNCLRSGDATRSMASCGGLGNSADLSRSNQPGPSSLFADSILILRDCRRRPNKSTSSVPTHRKSDTRRRSSAFSIPSRSGNVGGAIGLTWLATPNPPVWNVTSPIHTRGSIETS